MCGPHLHSTCLHPLFFKVIQIKGVDKDESILYDAFETN